MKNKIIASEKEISSAYQPQEIEQAWYQRWLEKECFKANADSQLPAYSMVIPPPNITGVLTLGHVLNNTIQDILARRARQQGHEVLWLPGTDHAGIATQSVVERQLRKEERKTRHDLGRKAFLEKVWQWRQKHGRIIITQLQRLGCSCDWSRECFTLDEGYARKVQEVFVDLYRKGLIYRGKRMVNWCPVSLTALSDEEVIPKKQQSKLYYFRLEVVEEQGRWLEVATTRPETIPGDMALAVNPNDARYSDLIGKHVRRPLGASALLPIIGDEAVEFDFGTGVLKVTPAHDPTDYEIGLRHQLPLLEVMEPHGSMNQAAGDDLAGLDRKQARIRAAELLAERGFLIKEEEYENSVGYSERADVPIEPRLSEQWFLRYPKTEEAQEAVRQHLIRFFPKRWEKVYDHWLSNIQDWCISRQLWWGHRIPVWYPVGAPGDITQMKVQCDCPGEGWEQDSDVLDTWFSSWLWAYETMDMSTREKFYPTSVLVTGPDIIFFWVARMIMAGLEYTGEIPFKDVYFTGIIRDHKGRKMSKSLGNSPNPLDLMDRYGADGLRFGIMRIAPSGQDIRFDEKQIEEGRNFANKLWNGARFRQMYGGPQSEKRLADYQLPDIAITLLAQLELLQGKVAEAYQGYRFQEIANLLYDFFWHDYCDWFVEASKPLLNTNKGELQAALLATIDHVFSRLLPLLHPFMPHITEELWERLQFEGTLVEPHRPAFLMNTCLEQRSVLAHLPSEQATQATTRVKELYEAITALRQLRGELGVKPKQKISAELFLRQEEPAWSEQEKEVFQSLGWIEKFAEVEQLSEGRPLLATPIGTIMLSLEGVIDIAAQGARMEKELLAVEKELVKVRSKLSNPHFVEKVPTAILEQHQEREKEWEARQEHLRLLQKMLQKSSIA